MTIKANLTYC